jgi:hypothetical protein
MSSHSDLILSVLCVVVIVVSFWVLYGTHPRVPR